MSLQIFPAWTVLPQTIISISINKTGNHPMQHHRHLKCSIFIVTIWQIETLTEHQCQDQQIQPCNYLFRLGREGLKKGTRKKREKEKEMEGRKRVSWWVGDVIYTAVPKLKLGRLDVLSHLRSQVGQLDPIVRRCSRQNTPQLAEHPQCSTRGAQELIYVVANSQTDIS